MSNNASGRRTQILAIDDEPEILEILKATLEQEGYRVHTAATPEAGLVYYEQHAAEVDLVLLDYLMPDMSGELVFECLQGVDAEVRVVLLTGCDDRVAQKMFAHGLRGYIQKPFFLEDLKAQIKQYLEPA